MIVCILKICNLYTQCHTHTHTLNTQIHAHKHTQTGPSSYTGYVAVDQLMSWNDAQDYCTNTYDTSLATITSDYENQLAFETAFEEFGGSYDVWIGLNDIRNESDYQWVDGTGNATAIYTNWGTGEPNNDLGTEHCANFFGTNVEHWNDEDCNTPMRFLCNYPLYHLVNTLTEEWGDAESYCKNIYGTDLATITNEDANNYIMNLLISEGVSSSWIGCNDIEIQDAFEWTGGYGSLDNKYSYWAPGEPNDIGAQDCCQFYDGGDGWGDNNNGWDDTGCFDQRAFICNFGSG